MERASRERGRLARSTATFGCPITLEASLAYCSWTVPRVRLLLLCAALLAAAPAWACPGDCDGDGTVRINELVAAVGIALGQAPAASCAAVDRDGDGQVTIAELITATNALLGGCPMATPTADPPSETPSPSPTATVNAPPALTPFVYRGFVGQPIARPLAAGDPNGDPFTCAVESPLPGMDLGDDRVLTWTPAADQIGVFAVPVSCEDQGTPPMSADGALDFRIAPLDACSTPTCDPATGCTATVPPPAQSCCDGSDPVRLPEAPVYCPSGRLLQIGGNQIGFGSLQNCNLLRFRQRAQSDASLRIHVRASCVNALNRVTISARLESPIRGVLVDQAFNVFLATPAVDGFYERRNLDYGFAVEGPFLSIENTEANLTVTVEDSNGVRVSETRRVILTSFTPDDLPDP